MTSKSKAPVSSAPVLTIRKLLSYRCLIDSEFWFVFWLHDEDTLGVTNGKKILYEKQISTADRKKLAGNVSESLLPDKWAKLFDTRAFTLEFKDDEVEVTYVRGSVILQRLDNDSVHDRIAEILNHSIGQMMSLSKKLAEFETKEQANYLKNVAAKRAAYRPEPKVPAKTRRPRNAATGLKFEDEDEDE